LRANGVRMDPYGDALARVCGQLDRPADTLVPVLDDPNIQQVPSSAFETVFQKVAARLDERDLRRLLEHPLAAGRLQRVLLDVLAGSKNRSFRNTWDYLDATGAKGNGTGVLSPGPRGLKDLRKTCATDYDEHVPESSIEILGHSVGGITDRHDAHRAPLT